MEGSLSAIGVVEGGGGLTGEFEAEIDLKAKVCLWDGETNRC